MTYLNVSKFNLDHLEYEYFSKKAFEETTIKNINN